MPVRETIQPIIGKARTHYYSFISGDYSKARLLYKPDGAALEAAEDVRVERFLSQRIGQLLEAAEKPVVVMDIGAGAGVTAMRLARQYKEEVRDSRLAVIVTNAGLQNYDYIDRLKDERGYEASSLLRDHLVRHITTDFSMGHGDIFKLPDGSVCNLNDGIDIVHERLSLTAWSDNVARNLQVLGDYLAPHSMYMVPFSDIRCTQPGGEDRVPTWEVDELHTQLCHARDLVRIDVCEEGPLAMHGLEYGILRGREALPVRIDPTPGEYSMPMAA
jgi:hypothetical protein